MIPAVNDQAANSVPPPLEDVPISEANFYTGDLGELSSTTDWLIVGTGLVTFDFYYDPDLEDFPDGVTPTWTGDALAKLLSGDFTYAIEFHVMEGEFNSVLAISTATYETGKRCAIEMPTDGYFLAFDWLNYAGDALDDNLERDITMDGDDPIFLTQGIHAIAFTRKDNRMACSIDGGVVKTVEVENHPFSVFPLTHAWVGGNNDAPYGQIIIGRARIFDALDDGVLPGLATPEVMTRPVNDDIDNATVIEVDDVLTGTTFCSTTEIDEPDHSEYGNHPGSVWWKFTAPSTADFTFDIAGSNDRLRNGTDMAIYTGGPVMASLVLVDKITGYYPPYSTASTVTISATMGVDYYIAVCCDGQGAGLVQISCTAA